MKRFTYGFVLLSVLALIAWPAAAQPGNHGNKGGKNHTGEHDSLRAPITVSGFILILQDSIYCNGTQYYLDTDSSGYPNYKLSFGPWWYSPDSLDRPAANTYVTITGFVNPSASPKIIRVYTIDGNVWRDTTAGRPPNWSGGWIGRHGDTLRAHDSSFCHFPDSGWGSGHGKGHMGGRWDDSVHAHFDTCQAPFWHGNTAMKAWEFTVSSSMGSMIMGDGSGTSYVEFNVPCTIRLVYGEGDFNDESQIAAYRYNGTSWEEITNFALDTDNNTVTFEENPVYEFYGITSSAVTGVHDPATTPAMVTLGQNYPNPFGNAAAASTVVPFTLAKAGHVHLAVYNATGKLVATLSDRYLDAGSYTVDFKPANLSGGMYFYRLETGGIVRTRAMTIIR